MSRKIKKNRRKTGKNKGQMKKGETRNPNGRPLLPPEIKELRIMGKETTIARITRIFSMTYDEIKYAYENKDKFPMNMEDACIARVALRAAEDGDVRALDTLWERCLGPVSKITLHEEVRNVTLTMPAMRKTIDKFLRRHDLRKAGKLTDAEARLY